MTSDRPPPSPPETPAGEGTRKPSPWMDPNHAFGPPASPASAPRETPGLPTPMPREERVGLVPDAEERLARLGRLAAATIAQPDPVKMAEGRGWVRGYADGLAEGLSRAVRTAPPESPASATSPENPRRLYRYCPGTDHPMAPSYCATTPHDECEGCDEPLLASASAPSRGTDHDPATKEQS